LSPPPPPPPVFPPLHPTGEGVSVVEIHAAVIDISLTIGGDMSSFDDDARQRLTERLQAQLVCQAPTCYIQLGASAGSVVVTASVILPLGSGANTTEVVASVQALASRSVQALSGLLGVDVEAAVAGGLLTDVLVPLALAPPPPPPPPKAYVLFSESRFTEWLRANGIGPGAPLAIFIVLILCCAGCCGAWAYYEVDQRKKYGRSEHWSGLRGFAAVGVAGKRAREMSAGLSGKLSGNGKRRNQGRDGGERGGVQLLSRGKVGDEDDGPLPAGWTVETDEDGSEYYWNVNERFASWSKPVRVDRSAAPPDGWKEFSDDEGARYFYNARTRQTTWTPPAELAKAKKKKTPPPPPLAKKKTVPPPPPSKAALKKANVQGRSLIVQGTSAGSLHASQI
jgi:hypothetical protein